MKQFKYIAVFVFLFSVFFLSAQKGKEKIEALRVGFITKQVELTTAEAEKFWPVYNEYNDKIKTIRKSLRRLYKQKGTEINEKEAEELLKKELQFRQAEVDVHKLYSEKLKSIIGVEKMLKLKIAEEKFREEVLKIIRGEE